MDITLDSLSDLIVQSAIEGTLNIVRQAEKVGIKRIVVTSSIGSAKMNSRGTYTDQGLLLFRFIPRSLASDLPRKNQTGTRSHENKR